MHLQRSLLLLAACLFALTALGDGMNVCTNHLDLYGDYSVNLSAGYNSVDLDSVTEDNAAIIGIGDYTFHSTTISNCYDVVGLGPFDLADAEVRDSHYLYGIGPSTFQASKVVDGSFGMTGVGLSIFATSIFDNCHYIVGLGNASYEYAHLTNSQEVLAVGTFGALSGFYGTNVQHIIGLGYETMYGASVSDSSEIDALGDLALASATIKTGSSNVVAVGARAMAGAWLQDGCTDIAAIGSQALQYATLVSSHDVLALGPNTGAGLYGTYTNVTMIGSGSTVTNSNDFVLGNSANNYFLPGQSLTLAGTLSSGGGPQFWLKGVDTTDGVTNLIFNVAGQDFWVPAAPH